MYDSTDDTGDTVEDARDVQELENNTDVGEQEVFFNKLVNSTTSKFKKLYGVAQDLYTAEDDVFRITNFLAEGFKYKEAYKQALKDGNHKIQGIIYNQLRAHFHPSASAQLLVKRLVLSEWCQNNVKMTN